MPHLRRFHGRLTVLALLVSDLGCWLARPPPPRTTTRTSQPRPLTVFVFTNVMTNAERRFAAPTSSGRCGCRSEPLSGCTPARGEGSHDTYWIDAGSEAGARLSLQGVRVQNCRRRARRLGRPGLLTTPRSWLGDGNPMVLTMWRAACSPPLARTASRGSRSGESPAARAPGRTAPTSSSTAVRSSRLCPVPPTTGTCLPLPSAPPNSPSSRSASNPIPPPISGSPGL